jgi:hypothetical protein
MLSINTAHFSINALRRQRARIQSRYLSMSVESAGSGEIEKASQAAPPS